ncbi:MAG: hypothetical protein K0R26_74 [Bacteroidota bacterium]|nr:hypothetical protein [Bacteroidota bacterium]
MLCSLSVFPQLSKKQIKRQLGSHPKEVSHEHFKDFKLITDMLDSARKVTYLRYGMKSVERIESGYATSYTKVKLQVHPRRSYLVNTQNKLEVLYSEGENNNKAYVKPHVFPYFTMSLDPLGNLMRKNQHFTIHDIGFDFTARTIAVALSKEKEQIAKHLTYAGKVEKNKMNCHLLIYENTDFGYRDYTVQAHETVSGIAGKLTVNDYMLRSKNKLYDEYGYLKQGSVIKIPTFYCKKAVFYIDEKTMLPISVSIYDEIGLFESYDFYDLEVNKPIPAAEFKKDFKGYGF